MLIEDECFIMSVKDENKWCEDQTPTLWTSLHWDISDQVGGGLQDTEKSGEAGEGIHVSL